MVKPQPADSGETRCMDGNRRERWLSLSLPTAKTTSSVGGCRCHLGFVCGNSAVSLRGCCWGIRFYLVVSGSSVFSGFSLLPSAIKRKHILLCMTPSLDISCWLCLTALLWVGEPDQTMSSLISYELIRNRRKVSRRFVGAHESKYQSLRLFEYDRHTHLPEFFLHDLNSLWISVHSIYVQGVSSDISN